MVSSSKAIVGDIFHNNILMASLVSLIIAQILKTAYIAVTQKRLDFTRIIGAGGMPSSHSSFVTTLTTMVGRAYGVESAIFAICLVFSAITMYDASGVRRAAGEQAKILNQMLFEPHSDDPTFIGKKLKELLGHTPMEVISGAALGILIGFLYWI